MRYISKGDSPRGFEKWKKSFRNKHGRKANYDDLGSNSDLKKQIKQNLLEEQYGLCCYCCKSIDYHNSHIEHFKPRDMYPDKSLEYENLHACCTSNGKTRHCGAKKDNWYSEKLISPLEIQCESLFEYSFNGDIMSAQDNERAKVTIEELGLDDFELQQARAAVIKGTGIALPDFNDELKEFWIEYFEKIEDGKLQPFCNAALFCLKTL